MNKKPGYILILTLLMVAAGLVLVTSVLNRSLDFTRAGQLFSDKEQIRTLAFGAIQIAIGQIDYVASGNKSDNKSEPSKAQEDKNKPTNKAELGESQDAKKEEQEKKDLELEQQWLKQLLSAINKWHSTNLTYENQSIDAEVSWYITAESGKFNLMSQAGK